MLLIHRFTDSVQNVWILHNIGMELQIVFHVMYLVQNVMAQVIFNAWDVRIYILSRDFLSAPAAVHLAKNVSGI